MFKSGVPALIVLALAGTLGLTLGAGPQATEQRSEAYETLTSVVQAFALSHALDSRHAPDRATMASEVSGPAAPDAPAISPDDPEQADPETVAARGSEKLARKTPPLDKMIGQMIVVGFKGMSAEEDDVRQISAKLAKGLVGGTILLGRNVESPEQLRTLTRSLRPATAPLKTLVSVDQEGGAVQRLDERRGYREIPSAKEIARTRSPEAAGVVFGTLAGQLAESGVNVNFGPVVDLDLNPQNPIIGALGRSFGTQPHRVAQYARWFITTHRTHNILTSPKHFPGHGSSKADSHKGFTDITKSWREVELEPFRELLRANMVDMIMVGHLFHPKFTDGGVPASLSAQAIQYWLRDELGYDGVVVTDDLNMGAIENRYSLPDATIRAINAGNDIVLYSNYPDYDPELATKVHRIIKDAVESGKIPRKRIAEAYERVRKMKTAE